MSKLSFLLLFVIIHCSLFAQRDYSSLVNPFIGTGGHGHTFPGASMPFGMMQLSPDTRGADWDGSSGYHYSDSVIYGFSHTHLSGTGIPDYCDVLMMPFTGEVQWNGKDYRSEFSHKNEKATPGHYEVLLDKNKIKAQLTTSYRSGMHQYTFPSSAKDGSILIDLKWRDEVLESSIEKVSSTELRGLRRSRSWAQNQYLYFYIQFDQPITKFVISNNGNASEVDSARGKDIKAFVRFNLPAGKVVKVKVGISGVSADGAKNNLSAEIPHWNFEQVKNEAKESWNKELSKIDVKGGTKDQQTIFYTALYHTFLVPNIYTDVDGQYRGSDLKIHNAEGFTNYTVFSLWDTYRAYHPLMTILNQKRTTDWINTFLHQYKNGGMLPVWELSGNETFCMIGYHSVSVITDAYQKGIRGFDAKLALEAMQSYAESSRFGLADYIKYGYLSNDKEHESVSKTLEYAYDDWCIAQFARMIGVDSIYEKYSERAQYFKNVFDPQTKKMRGKMQAMWHSPFDPKEINNFFTEGNSWQYSFAAPQDVSGMVQLYGGEEAFSKQLNDLFTTTSKTTGRDQADVTGLIGQYAHGNEPSHHMAYLFSYVKQPWRTQELIHRICNDFYENAPDGLIGNEDCGQMSAWYVLSALGFYPVCPGNGEYVLGTPIFDTVTVMLENGKTFVITATEGQKRKGFYVQSVRLNGRTSTASSLQHEDIIKGGTLNFALGAQPSKRWGTYKIPVSKISENVIVPVPYVDVKTNKFKDVATVSIKTIVPGHSIYYSADSGDAKIFSRFILYQKPFEIRQNANIKAYSVFNGKQSKTVEQKFFKLPSDISITVESKVHPMYTAGGDEALIDGIYGTTNWRAGEWQSYFDKNFEAVVDLRKVKHVSYVGIHVLQDVSPWILFPKEVIFYSSSDGKDFSEMARVQNHAEQKLDGPHVQALGTAVNVQTRYVKIKALNGGKLPAWHESAGSPSHIFIDEVVVK